MTRIVRRQSGRHISRRAEPGSSESFRRSSKGPGVADLVRLVLGHRRMTAQPIPAMTAYTGSHNDRSVRSGRSASRPVTGPGSAVVAVDGRLRSVAVMTYLLATAWPRPHVWASLAEVQAARASFPALHREGLAWIDPVAVGAVSGSTSWSLLTAIRREGEALSWDTPAPAGTQTSCGWSGTATVQRSPGCGFAPAGRRSGESRPQWYRR